jgi:hypothetical protein
MGLIFTISIGDTQHNVMLIAALFIVMTSVIVLNVVTPFDS